MRRFSIYILLAVILIPPLWPDSFSLTFNQNLASNLFQNRIGEQDQISTLSFSLDKNLKRFSLYTEGGYSYLYENPNLTYYVQDAGIDYIYPINEKSALYFAVAGRGAFYRFEYSDFNYTSVNLFAAFKSYLHQTSIFKSNYSFEYKNYKSSFYDFLSHSLSVSLDKYFQSKTTIKGEIDWGYKNFFHPYSYEEVLPEDGFHYGMGRGRGGNAFGQGPSQIRTVTQTKTQGIQVFSLSGLVAQGLGNKVGLNFSGMKQWVISGQNPFSFIEEFYAVENPSYDRFSWEGFQIGSQVTFLLPWYIQLKVGYTKSYKGFPGIESFDLEGNALGITREDRRNQIEVTMEKNFSRFSVLFSYYYINNISNDLYFDWNGHFFSVGIEWNISLGAK